MESENRVRVVLLPWLAHGHISPYVQLAKKLVSRNFEVLICSTAATFRSIRGSMFRSGSIKLIELRLPSTPELPHHLHTTNGLPPHLMPKLKEAFEQACPAFTDILRIHRPDLVVYDVLQPWAAVAASSLSIPAVLFLSFGAAAISYIAHLSLSLPRDREFPFPSISLRPHEQKLVEKIAVQNMDWDRSMNMDDSGAFILLRTFREIEGKYIDYLPRWIKKNIVTVGPLTDFAVEDIEDSNDDRQILSWLDKKTARSTVFVSFGSEYFLDLEDAVEIARGLELSGVNFVWVLRYPVEAKTRRELPDGYLDRVGERGMVVEWAPQKLILAHSSIAAMVSHCGWGSVLEAMSAGVPIVAMPMQLDQPINARLVEELDVGAEAARDGVGKLTGEVIAGVIRKVVAGESSDKIRKNADEMSSLMRVNGEPYADETADKLFKLCKKTNGRT